MVPYSSALMHKKIVVMGAMNEEIAVYEALAQRTPGLMPMLSGVSKTLAAAATEEAIRVYKPDALIFTGLGGALAPHQRLGDVIVGDVAVDYEMDARPLGFELGEFPYAGTRFFQSDQKLVELAMQSGMANEKGYVATGSKLLRTTEKHALNELAAKELVYEGNRVPTVVEMEGAAFLQICKKHNKPGVVIRALSDTLEGDVAEEFNSFLRSEIDQYASIVEYIAQNY